VKYGAPMLFVEMKSGGEALNGFGMFEAGTGKMGLYSGQPSIENIRGVITKRELQ